MRGARTYFCQHVLHVALLDQLEEGLHQLRRRRVRRRLVHLFPIVPRARRHLQLLLLLRRRRLRRRRRRERLLSHFQLALRRGPRHAAWAGLCGVRLHRNSRVVRWGGRGASWRWCGGELVCLDLHFWFCGGKWVIWRMACQIIGICVSRTSFNLYHKLSGAELLFP